MAFTLLSHCFHIAYTWLSHCLHFVLHIAGQDHLQSLEAQIAQAQQKLSDLQTELVQKIDQINYMTQCYFRELWATWMFSLHVATQVQAQAQAEADAQAQAQENP